MKKILQKINNTLADLFFDEEAIVVEDKQKPLFGSGSLRNRFSQFLGSLFDEC